MADITEQQVRKALEKVIDPDLRINIVDLGLIYKVEITEENNVGIDMTLTTQACPIGPLLQAQAQAAVKNIPGVNMVDVQIVWEPMWTPEMMSERLKKARAMGLL